MPVTSLALGGTTGEAVCGSECALTTCKQRPAPAECLWAVDCYCRASLDSLDSKSWLYTKAAPSLSYPGSGLRPGPFS